MELVIAYVAKALMLITSIVLYVYLFSSIIPKAIMKVHILKENTCDRGIKKFVYPNGRCVLYETELATRKYISSYALYTEDGYKYIKCKAAGNIANIRYDVYAFDNQNKLLDIIGVDEAISEDGYTASVPLPPETSYARFVLRRVDRMVFVTPKLVDYSWWRYMICAIVVALATAMEMILIYTIVRDILHNALRLKIDIASGATMLIVIGIISLIVAWWTVLAYRKNCKKVINR